MKYTFLIIALLGLSAGINAQIHPAAIQTYSGTFGEIGSGDIILYTLDPWTVGGEATIDGKTYQIQGTYEKDKATIDLMTGTETDFMLDLTSWRYGILKGKAIKGSWGDKIGKFEIFESASKGEHFLTKNKWNLTFSRFYSIDVRFAEYHGDIWFTLVALPEEGTIIEGYHGKLSQDGEFYWFKSKAEGMCPLKIGKVRIGDNLSIVTAGDSDEENSDCDVTFGENSLLIFEPKE